jgi:hypothetical protein
MQDADQAEEEDLYINNHDLIGVDGIIRAQKNEIEKKKVSKAKLTLIVGTENRKRKVLPSASRAQRYGLVVHL